MVTLTCMLMLTTYNVQNAISPTFHSFNMIFSMCCNMKQIWKRLFIKRKTWQNTLFSSLVNSLEWRWLFRPFRYMLIQTVRFIVWIISILDEELFYETPVRCTASCFVKIIWCSRWFCKAPPPPNPFYGCVLLYLRSPKGGCCSISDDLSCSRSLHVGVISYSTETI